MEEPALAVVPGGIYLHGAANNHCRGTAETSNTHFI